MKTKTKAELQLQIMQLVKKEVKLQQELAAALEQIEVLEQGLDRANKEVAAEGRRFWWLTYLAAVNLNKKRSREDADLRYPSTVADRALSDYSARFHPKQITAKK